MSTMNSKKLSAVIFVWSANPCLNTGQSLITSRFIDFFEKNIVCTVFYSPGFLGLLTCPFKYLILYFSFFLRHFFRSNKIIYLVCSRSNFGFFRDVPILVLSLIGAKIIVHVHGSDIIDLISKSPISHFSLFFYSRVVVVVPSEHLIHDLRRLGINRVYVIENLFINE